MQTPYACGNNNNNEDAALVFYILEKHVLKSERCPAEVLGTLPCQLEIAYLILCSTPPVILLLVFGIESIASRKLGR